MNEDVLRVCILLVFIELIDVDDKIFKDSCYNDKEVVIDIVFVLK